MSKAKKDLLTGLVLVGVTLAGFWSLRTNETIATFDFGTDPGPALFPRLLLSALGVSSLAVLGAAGWRLRRAVEPRRSASARPRGRAWWVLSFVATLTAYVFAMPAVGFLPATLTFSVFWTVLLRYQDVKRFEARSILRSVLAAAALTGAIYLLFVTGVRVPLP